MYYIKKNGGFTLVELIVVIAILAILAGVAVPAYSGYINSANQAADITTCDAVKTAAMASLATRGEVTKIVIVSGDSASVTATCNGTDYSLLGTLDNETADDDFKLYYGSTTIAAFKGKNDANTAVATTATWENSEWKFS